MNDEQLQVVMGLIMNAGNAKGEAVAALAAAKNKNFTEAEERMKPWLRLIILRQTC